MKFPVAERFVAPQGEGQFAGAPMAFVRLVGCSVGKKVCAACDTDFEMVYEHLGGGHYAAEEITAWAAPAARRICLTGGEPLDRDIRPLLLSACADNLALHVETSGTRHPEWLDQHDQPREPGAHAVQFRNADGGLSWAWLPLWICVSPKPGYLPEMVSRVADEVKVILGGLGDGPGWPTLEDAARWADAGRLVYLQPRNGRLDIDRRALDEALRAVERFPQLRLSVQLHKFIRTR